MRTKPLLAALTAVVLVLAVAPAFARGPQAHPPGPSRKLYRDAVVGHRVPPNAVYAIPRRVRVTLPRQPAGLRYAVVNDQVVVVSDADIVVDIIRTIIG